MYRTIPSLAVSFFALFLTRSQAHELVGIDVRPGESPNTAMAIPLSVFEAGERVARIEVHASVLYVENGRDIYRVISGTDGTNDLDGAWFYHPLFLGFTEPFKERTPVRNKIHIPLSGLKLPEGEYVIKFDFGTQTDITVPLKWREAAPGFLTIAGDGVRSYRPAEHFDRGGRPLKKEEATLADLLDGPEQGEARFVVPDEVEKAYHFAPLPRREPNEEQKKENERRRRESLENRKDGPFAKWLAPRDPRVVFQENELVFFVTNRPTLPVSNLKRPWDTFAVPADEEGKKSYTPTEKMATGAVLVSMDPAREKGMIEGSEVTKLFGHYRGSHGSESENEAAYEFMKHIWGRDILLYIHGFNVSFEAAMIQAAQLKRDLNYEGPVVALSWASLADPTKYFDDEKIVRKSIDVISIMLDYLIDGNIYAPEYYVGPPGKLNVIAHSMGNWVFLNSVGVLNLKRKFYERSFNNVILAAPDVAKGSLLQLGPMIAKGSKRVTLYYSGKDVPLMLSHLVHQGKRAGQEPFDIQGIDIIDVNNANEMWIRFGHSAYAASQRVLQDISLVLNHDLGPKERSPLIQLKPRLGNLLMEYSDWEFPLIKK